MEVLEQKRKFLLAIQMCCAGWSVGVFVLMTICHHYFAHLYCDVPV
jgi:hypothetical protein